MKFGRLEDSKLSVLPLPADHAMTRETLAAAKKVAKPRVYVGCPVWSDPKLVGRLYPKGTKSGDFLKRYAEQFNAIELNATSRTIPDLATVKGWVADVPKTFKFFPKVSLPVAGTAPLGKNGDAVKRLFESLHAFGEHYQASFLLLPALAPKRVDDLKAFLDRWDPTLALHVELRHKDWYAQPDTFGDLLAFMKQRHIGTVITDVTARRDVLHNALTTPAAFIRFDAHDLDPTDFARMDLWIERAKAWIAAGLTDLYFFPHTPEKYLNPELASYFISRANNVLRSEITPPRLLATQA